MYLFQVRLGDLYVVHVIERRVKDALLVFNHDQIIDVNDVRLVNLHENGRAGQDLLCGYVFPQGDWRGRVAKVYFPELPVRVVFEIAYVVRAQELQVVGQRGHDERLVQGRQVPYLDVERGGLRRLRFRFLEKAFDHVREIVPVDGFEQIVERRVADGFEHIFIVGGVEDDFHLPRQLFPEQA